jgi:hypothetical protein
MNYTSSIKIGSLPLLSVVLDNKRMTEAKPAVGVIAVGQYAYGFITLSQFGVGVICISQFGVGLIGVPRAIGRFPSAVQLGAPTARAP